MKASQLLDFIQNRMRMSHIYQPVMLKTLLQNRGIAPKRDIAKALLLHDLSQAEYYERIKMNMVGRVLRNHGIVEYDRTKRSYTWEHYSNNAVGMSIPGWR